jgi:hypothetical protein
VAELNFIFLGGSHNAEEIDKQMEEQEYKIKKRLTIINIHYYFKYLLFHRCDTLKHESQWHKLRYVTTLYCISRFNYGHGTWVLELMSMWFFICPNKGKDTHTQISIKSTGVSSNKSMTLK